MTVEDLIAREDIRQCLPRHFRAADRLDADLERRAFWEDGHFVGGPLDGPATDFVGPLIGELLPGSFDTVMHYIAKLLITINGERGFAELYEIGCHILVDDPAVIAGVVGDATFAELGYEVGTRVEMWVGVRYAVTMQRRDSEWPIHARRRPRWSMATSRSSIRRSSSNISRTNGPSRRCAPPPLPAACAHG